VVGIALHLGRDPVLDGDEQGAGIGTIMRAGGADVCKGHLDLGWRRLKTVS
jgi:hypothetical protein